MKRTIILLGLTSAFCLIVKGQDQPQKPASPTASSSYIVKTKGVKPVVKMTKVTADGQKTEEEAEAEDSLRTNVSYRRM